MQDPAIYDADIEATNAMKDYIRKNFSDILGPHAALLDQPGGLDVLADMVRSGQLGKKSRIA